MRFLEDISIEQLGWIALLFATATTLYLLKQILSGKTKGFLTRGFFESVGGEIIERQSAPLRFWGYIMIRGVGAIGLWLCWYACWFVHQ